MNYEDARGEVFEGGEIEALFRMRGVAGSDAGGWRARATGFCGIGKAGAAMVPG